MFARESSNINTTIVGMGELGNCVKKIRSKNICYYFCNNFKQSERVVFSDGSIIISEGNTRMILEYNPILSDLHDKTSKEICTALDVHRPSDIIRYNGYKKTKEKDIRLSIELLETYELEEIKFDKAKVVKVARKYHDIREYSYNIIIGDIRVHHHDEDVIKNLSCRAKSARSSRLLPT